jgi:thiol-disulfide isomerase/thioredoxin
MSSAPASRRPFRTFASCVFLVTLVASGGCKMQPADGTGEGSDSALPPGSGVRSVRAVDGDVAPLVRSERARVVADGRQLVVYVGATWCEPCQRFHHAVELGELDTTFPRLTLLEFDNDKDHERLATAGYVSQYIPLFALPKEDGNASGKQVEGGIKGEGAVGFVTTKLQGFLEQR